MLTSINNTGHFYYLCSLCHLLSYVLRIHTLFDYKICDFNKNNYPDAISYYPELISRKPDDKDICNYWFPLNKSGYEIMKSILEDIVNNKKYLYNYIMRKLIK